MTLKLAWCNQHSELLRWPEVLLPDVHVAARGATECIYSSHSLKSVMQGILFVCLGLIAHHSVIPTNNEAETWSLHLPPIYQ